MRKHTAANSGDRYALMIKGERSSEALSAFPTRLDPGGACVQISRAIDPGVSVTLIVRHADGRVERFEGAVLWSSARGREGYLVGVRFGEAVGKAG